MRLGLPCLGQLQALEVEQGRYDARGGMELGKISILRFFGVTSFGVFLQASRYGMEGGIWELPGLASGPRLWTRERS